MTLTYIGDKKTKICNCIGGANCSDESCEIVKRYRDMMKGSGMNKIRGYNEKKK